MIDILKDRSVEVNLTDTEIISEINRLRKERNAIILAHYYQESEIQDIADFVGDSLQLSQQAAKTSADVIVFAGVHFMAETAKILSPKKTVLLPDLEAGCSLADSCDADKFKEFLEDYPGHTVISYVNTTAEVKALTDIICTSSNALEIVKSLPADEKIVFAPDKNLGNYIKSVSGRDMVVWDGACHVHERFSLEKTLQLKKEYPDAKIIAHPECEKPILLVSDFIGSTSALLKFTEQDNSKAYIVCTESGILYQMRKSHPEKNFIPAPPNDSTCACNDCQFMKMITLKKIYLSLKNNRFEIKLDNDIMARAERPIRRMLEISEKLGFK
ncbi:MAG TPA: quinolinate synthase NadA [Bacteroidales bacterium]